MFDDAQRNGSTKRMPRLSRLCTASAPFYGQRAKKKEIGKGTFPNKILLQEPKPMCIHGLANLLKKYLPTSEYFDNNPESITTYHLTKEEGVNPKYIVKPSEQNDSYARYSFKNIAIRNLGFISEDPKEFKDLKKFSQKKCPCRRIVLSGEARVIYMC